MKKILLVGETWIKYTIHQKGFDQFTESSYGDGSTWLVEALTKAEYEVTHIPSHEIENRFPKSVAEIKEYDIIYLSDVGSNTLLLSSETFVKSKKQPNLIELIKDYVLKGGAFCMIGGYMSFSGIDGKARYGTTSIADILPVNCLDVDDRSENPEGINPVIEREHEVFEGIESKWPHFLGYNKTVLKDDAMLLATINGDPFIAVGKYGQGKSAVFTSDCAPHWGPPEFINWEHYDLFWGNLSKWLIK